MALHAELPVYKATYDLLLEIFNLVRKFTREYKYTLGESLKKEIVELLILIFRANIRRDKLDVIIEAREKIETIRLLMRVVKDLKQMSLRDFVRINTDIEKVSKQLTGWQKSL